jgi:elongation factor 1-gamma
MSSIGTLWTVQRDLKGKAIRAVAAAAGVTVDIPEDYTHYVDNKKPEYLAKFASGKIPSFEGKDGFTLFEGAVIARYVASLAPNSGLLPTDTNEVALVDQWVHFAESEVLVKQQMVSGLVKGFITPYNKPMHMLMLERHLSAIDTLEKHLSTRTFFVGERITLADIMVATIIQGAVTVTLDAASRVKCPNVIRHLETITNQPQLKDVFGPIEYVEKALQFVPPPKEKKDTKPAPAAAAPKAPKVEKAKAKEADDDEDEPLVPEEPKAKNPLDDLPKSTFNLEDWKRAYSNKETRGPDGSLEWFYKNFDKEGFSIWRVDFKYNEELTMTFMSSNQIGGFYNRLEASRKYLFGSVGVLGVTNASVISGVFILRGQNVNGVVEAAPDWESYSYTKLDLEDPSHKTFFEAALAWDLEIDGKKWVDGKNFK